MADAGELNVKVLVINEDELRRIIREEVHRAQTPAVYPLNIYPYQEPRQWWQNPVIC